MSREVERALEQTRADARERVRAAQEREARQKEEARRVSRERAGARACRHYEPASRRRGGRGGEFADDELVG